MDGTITEVMAEEVDAGTASAIPEVLWPVDRRPNYVTSPGPAASKDAAVAADRPYTCRSVWADLRVMHRIALARRRKRFQAGALSLNKVGIFRLPSRIYGPCMPIILSYPVLLVVVTRL